METIVLDGSSLTERESAFLILETAFSFPDYWGKNLDALYDCLTDLNQPIQLKLQNQTALYHSDFGQQLLQVLRDAAATQLGFFLA